MTDQELESLENETKKLKEDEVLRAKEKAFSINSELAREKARNAELEELLLASNRNIEKLKESQIDFQKKFVESFNRQMGQFDEKLKAMETERSQLIRGMTSPLMEIKREYDGAMGYMRDKAAQTIGNVKSVFSQLFTMKAVMIGALVLSVVSTLGVVFLAYHFFALQDQINNLNNGILFIYRKLGGE